MLEKVASLDSEQKRGGMERKPMPPCQRLHTAKGGLMLRELFSVRAVRAF